MSLSTGDRMPAGTFKTPTSDGPREISTDEIFKGKKVVLFAVPGAFTPTCNNTHFPGFHTAADKIKDHGVDTVACMAVNDIFVMSAWKKATGVEDAILMLADGNGDYAEALGLTLDLSGFGMGQRSARFAAVVDDGVVEYLGVEPGGDVTVSGADAVLSHLS